MSDKKIDEEEKDWITESEEEVKDIESGNLLINTQQKSLSKSLLSSNKTNP